jgi:hypothetical protein
MAKGKNSAALFEVIARSRPLTRVARPGLFRTAAAWFTSKPTEPVGAAIYRTIAPGAGDAGSPGVDMSPGPSLPAMCVDPNRREVVLRLSYTSAIISVFAMVTLVAVAFLAGRKVTLAHQPIIAPDSTEQLRAGPAQANLVDIRPGREDGTGAAGPSKGQPLPPAASRTRTVGVNYYVIQGYPEEKMATQAMNVLIQNSVDCTVVKGLKSWGKAEWFSVVGLEGFPQISNSPKREAYVNKVKQISDTFAKRGTFRAFEPALYKWKEQ